MRRKNVYAPIIIQCQDAFLYRGRAKNVYVNISIHAIHTRYIQILHIIYILEKYYCFAVFCSRRISRRSTRQIFKIVLIFDCKSTTGDAALVEHFIELYVLVTCMTTLVCTIIFVHVARASTFLAFVVHGALMLSTGVLCKCICRRSDLSTWKYSSAPIYPHALHLKPPDPRISSEPSVRRLLLRRRFTHGVPAQAPAPSKA